MKGSEYLAARTAITVVGFVVGGAVIAATALWIVPAVIRGLEALVPNVVPPLGGAIVGLAMVVLVSLLIKRFLGYYLVKFELWVLENGGIDD